MGEMADYYYDIALMQDIEDFTSGETVLSEYEKGSLRWRTQQGVSIKVEKMSDSHILNTKKMLERDSDKSNRVVAWIKVFEKEVKKRGI